MLLVNEKPWNSPLTQVQQRLYALQRWPRTYRQCQEEFLAGANYTCASGKPLPNLGEKQCLAYTINRQTTISLIWQNCRNTQQLKEAWLATGEKERNWEFRWQHE